MNTKTSPLLPKNEDFDNYDKIERYSLVPYDNYRNSLITVTRTSQMTDRDSLRRSKLFECFSQNNTNPEEFKDLNVNTEKMLDFFGGTVVCAN